MLIFIWRKKHKTFIEESWRRRLCHEAPKESENTDNANREDEGENFSTELESDVIHILKRNFKKSNF